MKLHILLLPLALALPATSHATLFAYEGFDYATGADGLAGQNGGSGFAGAWDNVANDGEIIAPTLAYTDGGGRTLISSGNMARMDGSTVGTAVNFRTLDTSTYASISTMYVSFMGQKVASGLGQPLDSRAVNLALFGSNLNAENISVGHGTNTPAGGVGGSGQYNWGQFWGGNGGNGTGAGTADTYSTINSQSAVFAVLKIELNVTGTLDQFTLYLNPSLDSEGANLPSTTVISTQDRGPTMDGIVNRLRPFGGNQQANGAGILDLDEIRLGSTWTDVTPFNAIPEPGSLGLLGLAAAGLLRRRRA